MSSYSRSQENVELRPGGLRTKKSKKKRTTTSIFSKRKTSEGTPRVVEAEGKTNLARKKKLTRSHSYVESPEQRPRLEHISTKLTLDVVSIHNENPHDKKRKSSSELGTVVTGDEVFNWIQAANPMQSKDKITETAQSLLDSCMIIPLKPGNKFQLKECYSISFPLFKPDLIQTITGVLTPFICSSSSNYTAKDCSRESVLLKRKVKSSESCRKIQQEGHMLSNVKNTGCFPLLSLCQSPTSLVMIQEFGEYTNLFSRALIEEKLSENAILHIIFQVASILEMFHERGYAYGLLNLNSIYIKDGNKGISERSAVALIDTDHMTQIGKEFTPSPPTLFTPPEYLTNNPKAHLTSDMWSLGVCSFWLLFGYPPYMASDVSLISRMVNTSPLFSVVGKNYFHISPVTRMILLQLLNPDPERRITAADLVLWPRKDISNLDQRLSYPYSNGWRSFHYLRMEGNVTQDSDSFSSHGATQRKTFRSFLSRGSRKVVPPVKDTTDIGVCSHSMKTSRVFVKSIQQPLDIDHISEYESFTTDNITTRVFTLDMDNLAEWQPAFSILSHLYFIVDLSKVDTTQVCNANSFKEEIKSFEKLYMYDRFYDKIRAPLYNIPITIVFINTEIMFSMFMKSAKSFFAFPGVSDDSFDSVIKGIESAFVAVKNRSPVPRIVKSLHFPANCGQNILEVLGEHATIHVTRCEAKDADSIIKRAIKLKLKRVNISFPFLSSKSKLTQLSCLSGALKNTSLIQDLNLSNLSLREKDFTDNSLFAALAENTSLTSLNLSYNIINDTGMELLCNALADHEKWSLESLILVHVKITQIGAKCISKLCRSLPSLKRLDVSRNPIGDEGVIYISEALFSNRTLQHLYLEDCGFYEGGFLALCGLLEIHTLKYLNIDANTIPTGLVDNMLASLRASMLAIQVEIKFPRFTDARTLKYHQRKYSKIYESHQAAPFDTENYSEASLNRYISNLSQPYPKRRNYAYCNLPKFQIPSSIEWSLLSDIVSLNLSHNQLLDFPEELLHLQNLTNLSLAFNQIRSLGKLPELASLRRLSLCENQVESINGVGKLAELRFLDLRWNSLRSLTAFEDLEHLEQLLLDGNHLLKVEYSVLTLNKLKNLSVRGNLIPLSKVMIYEAWSRDLRILDLSHIGMSFLPKEIFLLRFVSELNLSHNQLTIVPPQLGKLVSLRVLDLSYNQIRSESTLIPLLYLDLSYISLVCNDNLSSAYNSSSLTPLGFKELLLRQKEGLQDLVEIHRGKLMLVGKTGVGKTVVSSMLRTAPKLRKKKGIALQNGDYVATDGITVDEWAIDTKSSPPAILSVWDMAGADVYKTMHAFFLEERSIFLLLFNITISEAKQDIRYWLQMITASAPNSPILLVATHAEGLDVEDIQAVGNMMIQKYSSNYPNITNFISIHSFNPPEIETLSDSILQVFRSQNYIKKKVPAGYNSLISLIEAERHLCNPPFASMREFEYMVMNCGIDSSIQTVAEYLNLLGVISYFNDKKLGVSTSVVLDPSWLISLISTIITSRDNGIRDGVLYHKHLPTLWADYPVSLYPFLLNLFNKIEILYTAREVHPEKGKYSLIPSTFSTQKVGAQSYFIPVDDYLALGLGTQLERIYQFDFLPFGFFSRLVVRLLHFTTPTYYWRTGLVCASGENSGLVEFEMGRELSVKVRGRNPAKLLRVIVENIDLLLSGWYRNNATVIVPFILKGANYQKVGLDHKFSLEELEHAAAFGKTEVEFKEGNELIPIRIDSIAPDLVMADISEMLMKWDDLTIEKQVGQGAFGKVYSAIYKGKRVAVKQIEVEANMKTEAYREFRREVALCSELQQPAIVALCGVCLDPWCLALEYMPYGDLYSFLKNPENEITWKMRITMALNIAEAIRFLHSFQPKIIHRDLKSPNCLMASVDPDAEYLVKVTDFGESRAVATSYTGRDRLHNPVWLAPEIMKKEQYTEKADVFSFGIIMWELVGRTKPFDEYEIAQSSFTYQLEDAIIEGLRPTVPKNITCPPAYVQLMESCWDGDPKARPQFEDIYKQIVRMRDSLPTEFVNPT